jgi:hypothetical protein
MSRRFRDSESLWLDLFKLDSPKISLPYGASSFFTAARILRQCLVFARAGSTLAISLPTA